jgi:hypothetical protein
MSRENKEKEGKEMESGERVYIRYIHIWSDFDQEEMIKEYIIPSDDQVNKFYKEHFGADSQKVMSETVVFIDVEDDCFEMLDSQSILEIVKVS